MDALSKSIINSVVKYAPEKYLPVFGKTHTASWITNKIHNAIVKRDRLFEQWIGNPDGANRYS